MGESPLSGAFGGPLFVTILADLRQDVSQLGIKSSICLGIIVFAWPV